MITKQNSKHQPARAARKEANRQVCRESAVDDERVKCLGAEREIRVKCACADSPMMRKENKILRRERECIKTIKARQQQEQQQQNNSHPKTKSNTKEMNDSEEPAKG